MSHHPPKHESSPIQELSKVLVAEKHLELEEKRKDREDRRRDRAIAVGSAVIALGAMISAGVSAVEAHRTRAEANEIANKEMTLQQSVFASDEWPYLVFQGIPDSEEGYPIAVKVAKLESPKIISIGKTVAHKITITCERMKDWTDDWSHLKARNGRVMTLE